mmetsp:Transcript_85896/g.195841  ORF Transcript_85896/g.195841 Transcript_85896/m.195841 type:complete len:205 (+) Transcript_85896:61-675(+)
MMIFATVVMVQTSRAHRRAPTCSGLSTARTRGSAPARCLPPWLWMEFAIAVTARTSTTLLGCAPTAVLRPEWLCWRSRWLLSGCCGSRRRRWARRLRLGRRGLPKFVSWEASPQPPLPRQRELRRRWQLRWGGLSMPSGPWEATAPRQAQNRLPPPAATHPWTSCSVSYSWTWGCRMPGTRWWMSACQPLVARGLLAKSASLTK